MILPFNQTCQLGPPTLTLFYNLEYQNELIIMFQIIIMGTTQDVAVLTRKLGASDYDPTKYVAEISQV